MFPQSPPQNKTYDKFYLYDYLIDNKEDNLKFYLNINYFNKHEYIYKPPSNENYIYEIVEGAIKLGSYSESGEEHVYDILKKGDFFGNLKYLNGQFFEFSKTLVDTKLRVYDLAFFKETITHDPILADWFISYLLKRWCTSEKKLSNISGNSTKEKMKFLKYQFDVQVKDSNGFGYSLFGLLSQKDLGDLIGATRQTISSILKKKSIFLL